MRNFRYYKFRIVAVCGLVVSTAIASARSVESASAEIVFPRKLKKVNTSEAKEIKYKTSADNSEQPAMFYAPASKTPVPLIVALHTWSGNYKQKYHKAIEKWCIKHGWAYIHPDFRGPNNRPEATGSAFVVADIVSAVEYAKKTTKIEPSAIYLVGTSGGGYTALVMAGHHPEIWAGFSAWVPISDLAAWHAQGKHVDALVKSCGGAPGEHPAVDAEYAKRSPLTYLKNARRIIRDIQLTK